MKTAASSSCRGRESWRWAAAAPILWLIWTSTTKLVGKVFFGGEVWACACQMAGLYLMASGAVRHH